MKKNALDELAMRPKKPTKKELFAAAQEYLAMRNRAERTMKTDNHGEDDE